MSFVRCDIGEKPLFQGLAVEDLPDPGLLDPSDPDYQLIVTVIATKPPDPDKP